MSDETREAKIVLTGDASGLETACDRARDAQGRLTKTVKDSADEAGNAGKTNKELGKSHEEAGKKAEKHSAHLHGLHKICHTLNEIFPGLGVLMQAAFTPVGAAITLALMALRFFHEQLQETNEELKRMEEEAAKPVTHRMEAMREGVVRSAEGMAELTDRLHEAAVRQETFAEKTQVAINMMHEQFSEAQSLGDAAMRNELARLDQLHSAGVLSEEQYATQKLQIEQRFQEAKRQLQEDQEAAEIAIRQNAVAQAQAAQPKLEGAAKAAVANRVKAETDLNAQQTPEQVNEAKQKADEALKEWERGSTYGLKHSEMAEWFKQAGGINATPESLNNYLRSKGQATFTEGQMVDLERWQHLTNDSIQANKLWQKYPEFYSGKKVAADQAAHEADRAAKRAEDNQTLITESQRDIGTRQALLSERRRSNGEMTDLERDTLNRETGTGRAVTGAQDALSRLRTGGKFDFSKPEDVAQLQDLMELAKLLKQIPAAQNGRAVVPSAAGQVVSRELGHMEQGAAAEAARHGKTLGDNNTRILEGLKRSLASLTGDQARMLALIESSTGNQAATSQRITQLERWAQQVSQQVRYRQTLLPGEG